MEVRPILAERQEQSDGSVIQRRDRTEAREDEDSCHWRCGERGAAERGRRTAGGVGVDESRVDGVPGGRTSTHAHAVDERVGDHLEVGQQRHVEHEHERRARRHAFRRRVRVERAVVAVTTSSLLLLVRRPAGQVCTAVR